LAGLEAERDAFEEEGVQIVALSADDEEGAEAMKRDEGLHFPVLPRPGRRRDP
jgi:peroxiredoxin